MANESSREDKAHYLESHEEQSTNQRKCYPPGGKLYKHMSKVVTTIWEKQLMLYSFAKK